MMMGEKLTVARESVVCNPLNKFFKSIVVDNPEPKKDIIS